MPIEFGEFVKIYFDGIVSSLQSAGGVSVYFGNVLSRLLPEQYQLVEFDWKRELSTNYGLESSYLGGRFLERYRKCPVISDGNTIFHSSYYRLPEGKFKGKVVTTVHDFTYERFMGGLAKQVHSHQKFSAIRGSDRVICVSENTAKDLMEFCPIDESKIVVVHNGVSNAYHPLNGISNTEKVVFVGSRVSYKNFEMAVAAVSACEWLTLSIVGGGPLTKQELGLLKSYLLNRYEICGRLSDEELNAMFNSAYCLIYPSSYEGFGIPVIEAMQAGCPVLAVNTSSIPEVAGKAALLVDRACVTELVMGLKHIDAKREYMRQEGLLQAKGFSWDRCFKETMDVYRSLS